MIRPFLRNVCALALFAAASPAVVRAQDTFVIPPSFDGVCATGSASAQPFPFGTAPQFNYPYRYQQVYDWTAFPSIPAGQALRISEIHFRLDEFSGGLEQITYSDITVNLSTTARDVGALATGSPDELGSNLGADNKNVFSGGFTWDGCDTPDTCVTHVCGVVPPDSDPLPFDQKIVFSQPFWFDPKQGNLLLEVYDLDPTPQQQLFDAAEVPLQFAVTSRVREVIDPSNGTHLWPTNLNDNVGLVTEFMYTVPEPGAPALAAVSMLALGALRRRRG